MKWIYFLSVLLLFSCKKQDTIETNDALKTSDTINTSDTLRLPNKTPSDTLAVSKEYSNERFRKVTVEKVGDNQFRVRGQGQIFEANFSWVIEDGHNELKKGFQMTDAGAPEWGNFDFTVEATKEKANSTLTLILFETSAKDGSRQYELPITLY